MPKQLLHCQADLALHTKQTNKDKGSFSRAAIDGIMGMQGNKLK